MRGRFSLTYTLIALNLLAYLGVALYSGFVMEFDSGTLLRSGALYGPAVLMDSQWWRLGTAMFLHAGVAHLLLNMVSLWIVGRMMEHFFERWVYLVLYLLSGLAGFAASIYMHFDAVSVGASGAIFGIFGALGGYFFVHRRRLGERFASMAKEFAVILGLNLVMGLAIAGIDMSAHLGGLFVGILGGYLAAKSPRLFGLFALAVVLGIFWMLHSWSLQSGAIIFLPNR